MSEKTKRKPLKQGLSSFLPFIFQRGLHKSLIALINKVASASQTGDSDLLKSSMDDLVAYTESHFEAEEKLMADVNYIGLEIHKKYHRKLMSDVALMAEQLEKGELNVNKLMDFLRNWLVTHIQGSDKAYFPAVKQSGITDVEIETRLQRNIMEAGKKAGKKGFWSRIFGGS